MKNSSEVINDV